ncbi:hypothetical protein D1AOALGA4SA_10523 [Olavius algarvensis Delta 1 endosymbiont]|nr:hypothetical protein D1AOALGA4SA_10523 [Olavius algarvensis Delta 1 endosymbiont]
MIITTESTFITWLFHINSSLKIVSFGVKNITLSLENGVIFCIVP